MRDQRLVLAGTVTLLALLGLSSGRRRRRARAAAAAAGATTPLRGDSDPLSGLRAADLFDPMLERWDNDAASEGRTAPVVAGGRLRGRYLDPRTPTHTHRGVDILAPRGTPVRPLRAGTVVELAPDGARSGYGNAVLIEHDDGTAAFYAHLDGFGKIRPGQRIGASTVIGYVGSTQAPRSAMKMGPHLHLEVFAAIMRSSGGRALIHETAPERFDPVLYAELIGASLT